MKQREQKVAIVHDFLIHYGGAEAVLEVLCEMFPKADIFTLLYDEQSVDNWKKTWLAGHRVQGSFLQKFPVFLKKRKKWLLPLMPTAGENFNLRDYDLVISSSSAFAKGVVLKPKTLHFCYLHAPMRYVWDYGKEYIEEQVLGGKMKFLIRFLINYLRLWDRASAQRPDFMIANSYYTAKRIEKYYRRESKVIFPPVRVSDFKVQKENQGYFLTVARLSPYKRIELLVEVFSKLNLPLVIVGDGEEREKLKKIIIEKKANNIKMMGFVSRERLIDLYQNCRAFVFAADDDFGMVLVESMAAGKPVIALRAGGACEIVVEGETGEFFDEPVLEVAADAIRRFISRENLYSGEIIRKRAELFSREKFKEEFGKLLADNFSVEDKQLFHESNNQ